MIPWTELTEEEQAKWIDKAAYILRGLLACARVWDAWDVGTMTKDDFISADSDNDILNDAAKELYGIYCQGRMIGD